MRYIRENKQPEALIRCLKLQRDHGQVPDYENAGQVEVNGNMVSVKAEIRKARIAEQGGLCAYTMMRIDETSCHNEHLVPQSVSRQKGKVEETLDYRNIVACYPKTEHAGGFEFGAAARGTKHLEITPLHATCETRIRFDRSTGRAEPAADGDEAVRELIEDVLILNHPALIDRRLDAYNRAGVGIKAASPLSAAQARKLAKIILDHRRGKNLSPYCVAVAQAAIAHAHLIEGKKQQGTPGN